MIAEQRHSADAREPRAAAACVYVQTRPGLLASLLFSYAGIHRCGATGDILFDDIVWPDASIDHVGVFGQAVLARDRFGTAATVRLDRDQARAGRVSDYFLEHAEADLSANESHVSVAVSGYLDLGGSLRLTAGLGQVSRDPTVLERYSDRFPSTSFQVSAEFLGSPALRGETERELDVGLSYDSPRTTLTVDAFARRIQNPIIPVPDPDLAPRLPSSPPVVYRYENGTSADYYGAEATAGLSLSRLISVDFAGSCLWGRDNSFDEPAMGLSPLTGRVTVRVGAPEGKTSLALFVEAAARQRRVATSRFEQQTPGYAVAGFFAGHWFRSRLEATFGVANLFDKQFANHLNARNPFTGERVPEPGRTATPALRYSF